MRQFLKTSWWKITLIGCWLFNINYYWIEMLLLFSWASRCLIFNYFLCAQNQIHPNPNKNSLSALPFFMFRDYATKQWQQSWMRIGGAGGGGSWDWWSCDANKLFTDKLLLAKTEQDIYLILIHYSKQSLDFACERRHLWIIIFRHVIWIAFVHYLFKDFKRWKGDKSVSKILEKLWSEFKVDLHKYKYHMSINPRTLNWNTDL